jgi:hypothetical protein
LQNFYKIFLTLFLVSCAGFNYGPVGQANFEINQKNDYSGIIIFEQYSGKILVTGNFSGLKPLAKHSFKIFDKDDCLNIKTKSRYANANGSATDASNIIYADKNGNVNIHFETNLIDLGFYSKNIIGKTVIFYQVENVNHEDNSLKLNHMAICADIQENKAPTQIRADELFAFLLNDSRAVGAN